MRLAALYIVVWLTCATGLTFFELGWRPTFVTLWDGRAHLYVLFSLCLAMLLAACGFAISIQTTIGPRSARIVSTWIALGLTGFFCLSILNLSPLATARENAGVLALAIGGGLAFGLTVGLLSSLLKEEADKNTKLTLGQRQTISAGLLIATLTTGVVLLLLPRPRDDGEFRSYLTLSSGSSILKIGVFKAPLVGDTFGSLKIENGSTTNALVMEQHEWKELIRLALETRSQTPSSDRVVGVTNDTSPADQGRIEFAARHGDIVMTLSSTHGPGVSYDLIPTILTSDLCPVACADGGDDRGFGHEAVPGMATGVEYGLVGVPDAVRQGVRAEVLPDVLGWVQLWRVGRELHEHDVVGYRQLGRAVPTGAV